MVERLAAAVEIHPTGPEAGEALARWSAAKIGEAHRAGAVFTIALSGGESPRWLFEAWPAALPEAEAWKSVHFFWGDERVVPSDAPESNYGLAERTLLARCPVPREHVHPVPTGGPTAEAAAEGYESELRRFFGGPPGSEPGRGLDLAVQGIGPDGHTASLFPGRASLEVQGRWATVEPMPSQPPFVPRVSLTLPALCQSRHVVFLAGGAGKRSAVGRVLRPRGLGDERLPAARVRGREGTRWFLDREAAADLAPAPPTIPA